uniref:Photosystem II Psb27 protein n=2 Tax=Tetraselmis sp. GSL018 TaxID=582737 RepID=A0A061QVF2_9CHLO
MLTLKVSVAPRFVVKSGADSRYTSGRRVSNRLLTPISAKAQNVSKDASGHVSRRELIRSSTLLTAFAAITLPTSPAEAFLGIGEKSAQDQYVEDTTNVIEKTQKLLNLSRDDPAKADAVKEVRSLTNTWVSKYRRDDRFAGKPSFGNMYSVLNAISGHYNSFGPEAPIPKKRLDRILKELSDADRLLARGR